MAPLARRFGLPALFVSSILASLDLTSGCSASGDPTSSSKGGSGPGSGAGSGMGGDIGFDGGFGGSSGSGVPETCADAVQNQSYIGCEYWPTVTSNSGLFTKFEFAIAAANPTQSMATVTVERAGVQVAQQTIAPGALKTITLPWVDELKGSDPNFDGTGITSVLAPKGAYKVTSTVPITLYQFNPLEFELTPPPSDCPQLDPNTGACNSFTNDASLMLPTTALRNEYFVMSWPTLHIGTGFQWVDLPGFVTITATQDGTKVELTSTANVRSGPGVNALSPGQKGTYMLNAGDVVQLTTAAAPPQETPQPGKNCIVDPDSLLTLCPSPPTLDLTGSHIVASKPVSVIGGHDCTFIPFSNFACDHIEESMFPIEALGQDLIVTAPRTVASIGSTPVADSMFVRVLSAVNGNDITFDPPVHAPVTLDAGKYVEIGPLTKDFRVKATDKIMVGQYMVGENFGGAAAGAGDPSLSMAIPTEQYRVEYTFLAPSTYTFNIVNVVTTTGATISIDGMAIPAGEFTPIGGSGMSVARHEITGGTHRMTGTSNFGIVVYGYGSYTSYMYPGGLNLETIVVPPH